MTHDDYQDDHDWDESDRDISARALRLAAWQRLYDESDEPPKPIPVHAESPQWRHGHPGARPGVGP